MSLKLYNKLIDHLRDERPIYLDPTNIIRGVGGGRGGGFTDDNMNPEHKNRLKLKTE